MFWVGDQGESTFPGCALYSHTLELLLAFPYDWENETILPGALRHFKRYQTCIVTFLYILHCMDFRWWRGGGRMATAAGPSCGPSARGVKPPSVLRPGCCCYMQEIAPVDYWHQAHISSLGGPRHFGTGPGLTVSSLWHCLGHSQASLQCHFSRCKVGSFKGKRCRPAMGRPLRPLASFRGCRSGP